ncbi:hypothetical protein [Methylobacterium sp. J-077]|uniref:hypothetical protein n=1 Tax=Methylobacterium sp. J-077 TaxID=2836656 RepID=UPI001FBA1046|nr:hypothetical protein [Methylobacterium sp. J-077]MCJ2124349.1 hypothetical protein [Methylobacterium sp. J-077]
MAPEGRPSVIANDEYDAASEALVSTACSTRFGALAFLAHLRWWLTEEADFQDGHQPAYGLAEARAADLTLFLGTPLPPAVIPNAVPLGHAAAGVVRQLAHGPASEHHWPEDQFCALHDEARPGEDEPWRVVMPVRPDTAHVRAPRFLDIAGELLAAAFIIGGGMVLTGLATLL